MRCSESNSHFDEELLEMYAVGQLSDDGQIALIEEHLLMCFDCQVHLSGIDDYAQVAKAATSELKNQPITRKLSLSELVFGRFGRGPLTLPMPLWAAGLAVLALAVVLPYRQQSPVQIQVALSATRGANTALLAHATTHGQILLKIDAGSVPASPTYQVQVVNVSGHEIWRGIVSPVNNEILALIPKELLSDGRYWIRLSTGSDLKLLQEYGLSID